MKSGKFVFSFLLLITFLTACTTKNKDGFSGLSGPYLGQKPPGNIPEVFAPGIISTEKHEGCSWFSDDGKTLIFNRFGEGLMFTSQKDGSWTEPEKMPFNIPEYDWDFSLTHDGKTLYLASQRPHNENGKAHKNCYIWTIDREKDSWSVPELLPFPVNTGMHDSYPFIARDGTLYFFSRREGGFGKGDFYKSVPGNGEYTSVINLGSPVNTEHSEVDPYVSPDNRFIIICSDRPGGYGGEDLYIAFKQPGGSWTEPVNMGSDFNTPGNEWMPYITLDGKYLFYTSNSSGNREIYWVDASVINRYLPDNH